MESISLPLFEKYLTVEQLMKLLWILVLIGIGFLCIKLLSVFVRRVFLKGASEQSKALVHKSIQYIGAAIIVILVMDQLGMSISALLGAAGVLGVALGIASQKSIGNIISGLFLVSDKTFEVGDVIKLGSTVGIVHSLDLLSVKLRTFDNTFIRIPNDQIITAEISNITRFPIRRMDFKLRVSYDTDIARLKPMLLELARESHYCLREPEPFFLYQNFGESGIELLFAVWFEKSSYSDVKNQIFQAIKERFDAEGIEIPVLQVKLHPYFDKQIESGYSIQL